MRVQDRTPERLGPYRLIRRLGQGGMGVVYLASDDSGQQVAVKALHPGMAQEENARRRLGREVETMHRVRSQYVAQVLGADLDGDPPYIVTRYVPGLTLDAVISAGGAMSGQALGRLCYGLAQALAAVHSAGVVHRDLKPGNVMIADGEPVVIDFGIAQLAETTRLTLTGMFMGTPGYLAPEVIEGKDSGPGSDIHSWGATVAFAATGRPPFGTGTFEAIFFRIMHSQPDLDTLPASLRPMVLRALARDPANRPSAAELVQWAVSLDAGGLVPSPPAYNGTLAIGSGGAPATMADQADHPVWPNHTKPMGNLGPDDVRDLLPPVSYGAAAGPLAGAVDPATRDAVVGPYGVGPLAAGAGDQFQQGQFQQGQFQQGQFQQGQFQQGPQGPLPGTSLVQAGGYPPANGQFSAAGAFGGPAGGGGAFAGPAQYPARAGAGSSRPVAAISPWSPLVIASVGIAAAVSVMAPLVGTAVGLALLIVLRAASTTGRQLTRRIGVDGGRTSAPFTALVLYPFSLLRAVIGVVLLAPVALLACCIVVAATIIAVPVHPLPQALAFAAGALILIVGLGPGSSGSRDVLARIYGTAARTPATRAVAYLGVLSICAWAAITAWYQSPAAAYWPVIGLHSQLEHLPTLRHALTDVRQSVLRLARQAGL